MGHYNQVHYNEALNHVCPTQNSPFGFNKNHPKRDTSLMTQSGHHMAPIECKNKLLQDVKEEIQVHKYKERNRMRLQHPMSVTSEPGLVAVLRCKCFL